VGGGKGLGDTGVVGWLLPNKNTRLAPRPKGGGDFEIEPINGVWKVWLCEKMVPLVVNWMALLNAPNPMFIFYGISKPLVMQHMA